MDFSKVSVRALMAEFIGTFGLTGAVLASLNGSIPGIPTALVAGITLSLFVLSVGSISGTHINPAVTVGQWVVKKIDSATAFGYVLAQIAGALVASVTLQALIGDSFMNLSVDWLGEMNWNALAAEAIGMGVFAFGIAGAIHNKHDGINAAWLVGLSLTIGIVFAATVSNGVLNPAVAAGIESLDLAHLFGPLVGSAIGFFVYEEFLAKK